MAGLLTDCLNVRLTGCLTESFIASWMVNRIVW